MEISLLFIFWRNLAKIPVLPPDQPPAGGPPPINHLLGDPPDQPPAGGPPNQPPAGGPPRSTSGWETPPRINQPLGDPLDQPVSKIWSF